MPPVDVLDHRRPVQNPPRGSLRRSPVWLPCQIPHTPNCLPPHPFPSPDPGPRAVSARQPDRHARPRPSQRGPVPTVDPDIDRPLAVAEINTSAFLNHWTSGTLSLQGSRISEWVPNRLIGRWPQRCRRNVDRLVKNTDIHGPSLGFPAGHALVYWLAWLLSTSRGPYTQTWSSTVLSSPTPSRPPRYRMLGTRLVLVSFRAALEKGSTLAAQGSIECPTTLRPPALAFSLKKQPAHWPHQEHRLTRNRTHYGRAVPRDLSAKASLGSVSRQPAAARTETGHDPPPLD